jgi:hypothetical protein
VTFPISFALTGFVQHEPAGEYGEVGSVEGGVGSIALENVRPIEKRRSKAPIIYRERQVVFLAEFFRFFLEIVLKPS